MANQENRTDSVNERKVEDTSSTKDFIIGALIGGLVGAATAFFLAPKSGTEFRHNLNEQAAFFRNKGEQLRDVAISKGSGLVASAKEKKTNLPFKGNSHNEKLNKELEDEREYVQLKPFISSKDDVQKKLLDTQKALEEVEEKIRG